MTEELKKIYSYPNWRQSIELGNGFKTPGFTSKMQWEILNLPNNLTGKSFLDVGANDGLLSFEAEKRGASYIVASDLYKDATETMKNGWFKDGIVILKKYFNSKILIHDKGIYDLNSLNKQFDIVLVNNVIVWLEDADIAIAQLALVTKDTLFLADGFLVDNDKPLKTEPKNMPMRFMYNLKYMTALMEKHGFKIESITGFNNQKPFTKNFIELPQLSIKAGTKIYSLPDLDSEFKLSKQINDQTNLILGDFFSIGEIGWFHKSDVIVTFTKPSKLYVLCNAFGLLNAYYAYLQRKHIKKNGNTGYIIKASKKSNFSI